MCTLIGKRKNVQKIVTMTKSKAIKITIYWCIYFIPMITTKFAYYAAFLGCPLIRYSYLLMQYLTTYHYNKTSNHRLLGWIIIVLFYGVFFFCPLHVNNQFWINKNEFDYLYLHTKNNHNIKRVPKVYKVQEQQSKKKTTK